MAEPAPDVHVVAHTHWDREWYLTREEYRLRLVALIDGVLELMRRDARFRFFHLDGQTIVLEDYLEVRPEREADLRERIAEGRLLVGPWYVMPDMHLVSGEALVRNLALGHRIADSFGAVMRAGYMPDPFGHVAQMPQILRGFGLADAVLWRGFGGERAEYRWHAPDGSSVLLLHLPRVGYCNALWLPLLPAEERRDAARKVIASERERSLSGALLLMAGVDHVEPHPALFDLIDELRADGVSIGLSTLPEYAAAAAQRLGQREVEEVRGELRAGEDYAPLLPGVLSARTYLKQANARCQTLLERRAEPLSAFAWLLGALHPTGELRYAWKTLLENHPHDSICGCSVDAVHDENETRFARVDQAAAGIRDRALEALGNAVAAAPPGVLRFLAVNADAQPFSGVLTGVLDIPYAIEEPGRRFDPLRFERPLAFFGKDAALRGVLDPDGASVPFQVLDEWEEVIHYMSRHEPPLPVRARRLNVALQVSLPACSSTAFDAVLDAGATRSVAPMEPVRVGDDWLENEHLRVKVGRDGLLEVRDKRSRRTWSRVLELVDCGDLGDEYNFDALPDSVELTSADAEDVTVSVEQNGPLVGTLRIAGSLALGAPGDDGDDEENAEADADDPWIAFSSTVRLRAGSRRVDVSLRVWNGAEDHRLRVLFPTGAERIETARADAAFAVVARPARRDTKEPLRVEAPVSAAPLHSFVDAGDATSGISVFTEGLPEYEVTPERQVAVTLLRCVGWLSRDDLKSRRGHAGPGLETPGAQCPGEHVFRFAFAPRGTPPSEASLVRDAREFLAPPVVFGPAGREGRLPRLHRFVEFDTEPAGSAVLSALKHADGRDSLIVRVFNPAAAPARVRLSLPGGLLAAAYRTDLREQRGDAVPLVNGTAELVLGPSRIETLELVREKKGAAGAAP